MTEQPAPVPSDRPDMWLAVIEDMRARRRVGIDRYKTPLQPFNGRDPERDRYEEILDWLVYTRQAMTERRMLLDLIEDARLLLAELRPGGSRFPLAVRVTRWQDQCRNLLGEAPSPSLPGI